MRGREGTVVRIDQEKREKAQIITIRKERKGNITTDIKKKTWYN